MRESGPHPLDIRSIHQAHDGYEVVRALSSPLERGPIGCLLGPSGCGKTTVLRCIAGFESIARGEILLNGRIVSAAGVMVPPEERRIGMVFQDYALFPHLSTADNVGFGLHVLPRADRPTPVT